MDIPEYYRQFQTKPTEVKEPAHYPEAKTELPQTNKSGNKAPPETTKNKTPEEPLKGALFRGNGFSLIQPEEWQDKTIYTITGPVSDGIQHNIIINVDHDVPFENVNEYAEWQLRTLTEELKGCTLLSRTLLKLPTGIDAVEAFYSWYLLADLKIYQKQMYILNQSTAYKMTASFTKKTQHTMGPVVEKIMLSFSISDQK